MNEAAYFASGSTILRVIVWTSRTLPPYRAALFKAAAQKFKYCVWYQGPLSGQEERQASETGFGGITGPK
jgi:hypothetical protein